MLCVVLGWPKADLATGAAHNVGCEYSSMVEQLYIKQWVDGSIPSIHHKQNAKSAPL